MAELIDQINNHRIHLLSAIGGWDEKLCLFGIQIIDVTGFTELAVRFIFKYFITVSSSSFYICEKQSPKRLLLFLFVNWSNCISIMFFCSIV